MELFWRQGCEGTSYADLAKARDARALGHFFDAVAVALSVHSTSGAITEELQTVVTAALGAGRRALLFLLWSLGCAAVVTTASAVTFQELLAGPAGEEHVYRTVGATKVKLHVFRPVGMPASEPRPAVVWIHGGGWTSGAPDSFFAHARYVATRGAVGISLGYRLVRAEGPTLGDAIADCRAALLYLRTQAVSLGLDPTRIAVAGDSAGGHLAAALATLDGPEDAPTDRLVSARPDALLLFGPVLDLTDPAWIRYAVGGGALANRKNPLPPDATARGRALSPLAQVRPGMPPTLLLHGRDDTTVPPGQSERFAAAMAQAGNRCDLTVLDGTRHAFVVTHWRSPEPVVVAALCAADHFLVSLGYLSGEPTLEVSPTPAWTVPPPKKP